MKISQKITIKTYFRKKSKTLPEITLGETDSTHGNVSLFAGIIANKAAILKNHLTEYSIKSLAKDLFFLVLFHEFHHVLAGCTDREKEADIFAEKVFRIYFKRPAIVPFRLWRNLPKS